MVQLRDIFLALLLVEFTVSLEVQITPTHGEISLGESKFFMCEVVGVAKHIDWFGPSGDRIEPNRPDITVTRNDESSSTLTLYKAGTENAGTYKCVATNGDQQGESTVKVKIFQKITFTNAPSPQEFTEGDNANIVCDVISSPPPTIFWKYKGAKIQMEKDVRFKVLSNNHLQIRGIKKTDEGLYTCEGRLMARGEIDLRVIKVVVNVLPTIRVWQSEVNATADVGQPAMLTCAVDGYPEPMVTWTRNGVVLDAGEKYSFNDDGSEMTLMEVTKLDEGDYTCIAKNKAGESEQELSLRVFVKPKITYIVNQSTSEMEEQVTLTCEASGDPTPTISWSAGDNVFTEGEQAHLNRIYQASWTRPEQHKSLDGNVVVRSDARVSSLTLKYVKYTDAGQYLCTARSAIGEDDQLAYLEVRYAPKIQGAVAVYTWEGNAVNISCEVKAHPNDVSIVWLRDGLQLPNSNTTNIKIFRSPSASYLQITPESENDFGSYNCTASNEMGTESKEFLLIQAEVPSAPSISEVRPFSTTAQIQFEEPESTGGVPVLKYRAEWKAQGRGSWVQRIYEVQDGYTGEATITGLKPETSYEVKLSAINGKGEGESSPAEFFKTEPVRNPNPPKIEGALQPKGNSLKVSWIKQDDGGSPILHYLVRYKPIQLSEWKPEIRLPSGSEYVVLSGLEWDTEYNVYVVAENQKGKSQPATMSFRTSTEPEAIPDLGDEAAAWASMGIMLWAGILVVVFVLLLLAVDVTCYFVNKCGLIMCLCGKSGTGTKGHNLEEGKAAFMKDESKEPIVEVRTEDECTANHNAAGPTEPNETTPLTEPELAAYTAALALDTLSSVATNSDTATATIDPAQDSPSSETTTLTCSLSTPANDPSPTPVLAPAPTPESNTAPPTPLISTSAVEAKMAPLVEQRGSDTPEEQEKITTSPRTPEWTKPQKAGTPIPPKRRHSPKLAAMNAKGSPPVSPLATSSPSSSPALDTKKPAPKPPLNKLPLQPHTVALDTETPAQTASTLATTAPPKPDPDLNTTAPNPSGLSLTAFDTKNKPVDRNTDKDAATSSPPVIHGALKVLDAEGPAPLVADVPSPLPVTPIPFTPAPATVEALITNDLLTSPSDTYDLVASDGGPKNADLELELTNGTERPPLADLISLESPPSAPSLPNGDGADLPPSGPVLEASETLAKTAPPVNDEKIFSDEKGKLEEADLSNALTEIAAEHNSVIQTNTTESKA
ncbi:neural cell adhesion molecule 1b isoform X4 [Centropristis striata]|uniref:neural cell adhesion molecule 1b isoform X4 n=1 Tax=Centropristis striata TaxID=184440 RepID=UPI0027E0DEF4|nr:neural cell adhesion molecule 1b isoform X4 [Centropristis striata]